jgi:glutamate-5-semialdehyde dehydrogenase
MDERIGFLGFGTMSSAIARGLLRGGHPAARMAWYNPSLRYAERAASLGLGARAEGPEALIADSDVVFLGMKPQQAPMALMGLQHAFRPGQVVVSMLAGLRVADLAQQLPQGVAIVRVMPNTPVGVGQGVVGVVLGDQLEPGPRVRLMDLLQHLGDVVVVAEEQMDALTAVSGSGPAFVYRWMEAFERAAAAQGFDAKVARSMVRRTFTGALSLLEDQGGDAAEMRRAVTSKAGMTEAGLRVLDQADPDGLMTRVLQATAQRGATLAQGLDPVDLSAEADRLVLAAVPAGRTASGLSDAAKTAAIDAMADALEAAAATILEANAQDCAEGAQQGLNAALMDRLLLDAARLNGVVGDLRAVGQLPDPVGQVLEERPLEQGLVLRKVAVPIGVVAVIYESRPNVTVDAAGLCLRSGNAVILRGGKEARRTSQALVEAMRSGLRTAGVDPNCVQLVGIQDRAFLGTLLKRDEAIQLVVPRGGPGLIRAVVNMSRIPVVKHDKGLCSVYVHEGADFAMAQRIVLNAKVQRPGVCNAIENLVVDAAIAAEFLPLIGSELSAHGVALRADAHAMVHLPGAVSAAESDWDEEYLDLILAVRVVRDLDEAIAFTRKHSSQHSDAIVTGDAQAAQRYLAEVDSAAVYHNASTRFTDGGCFGLGAEVGISTNRLHARGPMGLAELCTYKFQVLGSGQIRR